MPALDGANSAETAEEYVVEMRAKTVVGCVRVTASLALDARTRGHVISTHLRPKPGVEFAGTFR